MLNIRELPIQYNRSYTSLFSRGALIHSTATPGASAWSEYRYFNSGDRQSSAHAFIDWTEAIITVPLNEQAWHAGQYANPIYHGFELCEPLPGDREKFEAVWNNAVEFVRWYWAHGFPRFLQTHDWATRTLGGTDHSDPVGFFASYGRTFEQFVTACNEYSTIHIRGEAEHMYIPTSRTSILSRIVETPHFVHNGAHDMIYVTLSREANITAFDLFGKDVSRFTKSWKPPEARIQLPNINGNIKLQITDTSATVQQRDTR